MSAKLTNDDGADGSAFGGRVRLPIKTEALAADATVNVFAEVRSSE
jgi:hypothetical protein